MEKLENTVRKVLNTQLIESDIDDHDYTELGKPAKWQKIKSETSDSNGNRHSENDEPALVLADGSKFWYTHGKLDRDEKNGPAAVYADGVKVYWKNDQRHRKNGAAIEFPDGTKEYWVNGELSRDPKIGPAIRRPDGTGDYYLKHRWLGSTGIKGGKGVPKEFGNK